MNSLNGGYAMIKYNSTQEELQIAYRSKKPVLCYDENRRAHWAVIEETATESVDEETQEPITIYEYSYQLLNAIEVLVDDNGNSRFIEGDGVPATIDGFTSTYCKWSLSGTHLMCVVAGAITNETTIASNTKIAEFNVPSYIMDKIVPIFRSLVNRSTLSLYADDYSTQTVIINLIKSSNINIQLGGNLTLTSDKSFRIQFDLLIDTE